MQYVRTEIIGFYAVFKEVVARN